MADASSERVLALLKGMTDAQEAFLVFAREPQSAEAIKANISPAQVDQWAQGFIEFGLFQLELYRGRTFAAALARRVIARWAARPNV